MTALTLLATGRLTASLEDRVITGMLLPYNEEGRTNLGRLTASADSALTLADLVPLNVEHKPQDVIGKAVTVEVAGDAALLIAPEDVDALRAALARALQDEPWRQQAHVAGLARAATFSWKTCVDRTVQVYQQLLRP